MDEHHPKNMIVVLARAMVEAEQVAGSTGPDKKAYAVQAMRSIAAQTLSFDEALLVGDLAPYLVDLIVSATKGLLDVNVVNGQGEPSPHCCLLS